VLAVLDDGIALLQRLERHLMADRDIVAGLERQRLVGCGDDAQHIGAGTQSLDYHDTDIVLRAMDQKVRCSHAFSPSSRVRAHVWLTCLADWSSGVHSYIRGAAPPSRAFANWRTDEPPRQRCQSSALRPGARAACRPPSLRRMEARSTHSQRV